MLIDKKIFYKNLIRLALPIALQSLMLAAVAAGDALMLGKVAQDEMTAVSLATQIQFVQNMFLGAITAEPFWEPSTGARATDAPWKISLTSCFDSAWQCPSCFFWPVNGCRNNSCIFLRKMIL